MFRLRPTPGHATALRLINMFVILKMTAVVSQADDLDNFITNRMQRAHISGLSLAVVQDGQIIKEKGYGFTDHDGKTPVTPSTLFQAGSVSKPVAAFGVMRLVQDGKLSLDADINTQLRSWKLPDNEFTKDQKVTLRRILSHTAGLTIHGFRGYAIDSSVPTLTQVLDGQKPANSSAIRVNVVPGTLWRYSGGGYTVMQQMVIDTTGKPFPEFMRETVLKPLGMTNSSYEQPLPADKQHLCASGYYEGERAVPGRWHVYPEMAAAGLWTTASDLARFVIAVQRALAGTSNPVLSQSTMQQMLTIQPPSKDDGLGLFVRNYGKAVVFWHAGNLDGFDTYLLGTSNGNGIIILMNAHDTSGVVKDILHAAQKQYARKSASGLTSN